MTDFEKHRAIVTNVDDPDMLGRVMVRCATLLDEDMELPFWIPPKFHYVTVDKDANGNVIGAGWFAVPAKDTWVDLEVPVESRWDEIPWEQSLQMEGAGIRYKCTLYNDVQKVPEIFKTNYPQRAGTVWPSGWVHFVDSKTGEMQLAYYPDQKKPPEAFIKILKDHSILLENKDGQKVHLLPGKLIVEAAGPVEITGDNVFIGDPGATEHIPLGDALFTFLNTVATGWGTTHTHQAGALVAPPGGGPVTGVTGTPVTPMDTPVQADLVSGKHTVEK